MPSDRKVSLQLVVAPPAGTVLNAPPVLTASDHSIDYACGNCATVPLHADQN
jgi:hypothetical protein